MSESGDERPQQGRRRGKARHYLNSYLNMVKILSDLFSLIKKAFYETKLTYFPEFLNIKPVLSLQLNNKTLQYVKK
jgi:hypothetical protein